MLEDMIDIGLLLQIKAQGLDELLAASNLLEGLGKAALGVAGVLGGALVGAVGESLNSFKKLADQEYTMSQRFGISNTQAGEWIETAKILGVSGDGIERAFSRISNRMGQMKIYFDQHHKISPMMAADFNTLGVKLTEHNGKWRNLNDIMLDAMDRMGKMTDINERNRISLRLFGDSQGNLIDMYKAGRPQLEAYMALTKKLGAVIGDEQVANVRSFEISMNIMGVAIDGIKNMIAQEFMPYLVRFEQWLAKDGIDAIRTFTTNALAFFDRTIQWVVQNWPQIQSTISGVWSTVKGIFGDWITAQGGVNGITDDAKAIFSDIKGIVSDLTTTYNDNKDAINGTDGAVGAFMPTLHDLRQVLDGIKWVIDMITWGLSGLDAALANTPLGSINAALEQRLGISTGGGAGINGRGAPRPRDPASDAFYASGGQSQTGQVRSHARGGVAWGPELAMLGEEEPEAIIPFSKLGNMGGGNSAMMGELIQVMNECKDFLAQIAAKDLRPAVGKEISAHLAAMRV